jgi:hypothetical protein
VPAYRTIGGVPYAVVLDTGSRYAHIRRFNSGLISPFRSDLWVLLNGTARQSNDLGGAPINVTYGGGSVLGNLHTAKVEIGGASIDNQILLEVAPENSTTGVTGILGVGPPILSNIFTEQNGSDACSASLAAPVCV